MNVPPYTNSIITGFYKVDISLEALKENKTVNFETKTLEVYTFFFP